MAQHEVVVSGSLSGGPVKRYAACRARPAFSALRVAIAGRDVAYSGSSCERGVWLGDRIRLAARGELRALSATSALVSFSENNQRLFYQRWEEFMNAESWADISIDPIKARFDGTATMQG